MDCVAVIPARYGSTRFPGKVLASLDGHPVIHHVIDRCRDVEGVDEVVVATDDSRVAEAAEGAGVRAVMTPTDVASGTDRVALACREIDAELVVNVQGDEPFVDAAALSAALRDFRADDVGIGTLRAPLREVGELWNPHVTKVVVDGDGRALYFSKAPIPFDRDRWLESARSGELRPPEGWVAVGQRVDGDVPAGAWAHVGVYLCRRGALMRWAEAPPSTLERLEGLEQLRVLEAGETIQTYRSPPGLPGIDTEEDLERARRVLAEGRADKMA